MSRGASGPGPTGLCIVDKPPAWTSHDVVARARGILGTRKVGHAGTLDPMATGVLVLGVGRATRLLTFITGVAKRYDAAIRFGTETDSLDADGQVVATHDMSGLTADAVRAAAAELTGDLLQIPPMVSAIQVDGRRLHELAREGIEVERPPRPVHVPRFDVEPTADPLLWRAVVECSSGTYVRSLAADLGSALGGGAHLAELRRTAVGPFSIDEARDLDHLELLPAAAAVRHLDRLEVGSDEVKAIGNGALLRAEDHALSGDGPWAVFDPADELLAVYQQHTDGRLKPAMVLAAPPSG